MQAREVYVAYRKAGYSKKFREEHEEEILLHQAAKNAFDEMGVKKLPKVKELQTEYAKLLEEKKKTYAEYRHLHEEMRELLTAKANVDRVLKMEVEQDVERKRPRPAVSWSSSRAFAERAATNEILCSKGLGGAALQQASGEKNHGGILHSPVHVLY